MAFPTIPTAAAGRILTANQANATATRTFPDLAGLTKSAGDLLIAIVVGYQSSTTNAQFSGWSAGWTEFHDSGTSSTLAIGMAYKWSTGSETGAITVTQAGTIVGHASMMLLSIPGAHATTPPEAGGRADGTTALADPASFDPAGWAAEDALWIAVGANGETSATGSWTGNSSPGPTNYSGYADSATADTSTVGQVGVAVAFRQLNASAENPGVFTGGDVSNARNSAMVIAVRPAPVVAATITPASGGGVGSGSVTVTTPVNASALTMKWDLADEYQTHVMVDTPLLYWRSGEASGSLVDSSGNSRPGTENGGVTRDIVGAIRTADDDGAVAFDGTSGYISSAYNPFSGQKTFEMWVRTNDYAAVGNDAMLGSLGAANPQFVIQPNGNVAFVFSGLTQSVWSGVWPGDGRWTHVVVQFDDNSAGLASKLYLNGVDQGAPGGSHGAYGTTSNFSVGARGATAAAFLNGDVDEIAIYSGFLSAARVADHFAAGQPVHVRGNQLDFVWDIAAPAGTPVDGPVLDLTWDTIARVDGGVLDLVYDLNATAGPINGIELDLKWDVSGGQFWDAVKALGSGVKMHWRADEPSGAALADESGNGNTGTANGSFTRNVAGLTQEPGKGISLDGSADATAGGYVIADAYAPFVPNSQRSVSMLFKIDTDPNHIVNLFCDRNTVTGNDSMVLELTVGLAAVRYYGDVAAQFPAFQDWPYQFVVGQPYHLVFVVDDSATTLANQLRLYVNGEDLGAPTVGTVGTLHHFHTGTTRPFQIGRRDGATNNEYIDATEDEIVVYEGLLSGAQVSSLWSALDFGTVSGQPRSLLWDTIARVDAAALTLKSDLAGAVAQTETLKWDLRSAADGGVLDFKWDLVAQVNAAAESILWDLRASANGIVLDALWDLNAAVAATETIKWDLASAVAATETLKWDVIAQVDGISLDVDWDMGGAVNGAPSTVKWDVRSEVAATETLAWDLRSEVAAATESLSWDLRSQADGSILDALWDLRAQADAGALDLTWDLASAVAAAETLVWDLIAQVSGSELDLPWDMETFAAVNGPPLSLVSDLRAEVAQALMAKWDLISQVVGNELDLPWDMDTIGAVNGSPSVVKWDLRAEAERAIPLGWDLSAAVSGAVSFVYDLRNEVAAAETFKWDVIAQVAATRTLLWDVIARVDSDPQELLWDLETIGQVNGAPAALKWDLIAQVASGIADFVWDDRAVVDGNAESLKWDLNTAVSAAESLVWDLRAAVSGQVEDLKWDVRAAADGAVEDLKWDLRAEMARSLSALWDLRTTTDGLEIELLWDLVSIGQVNGPPVSLVWDSIARTTGGIVDFVWDSRIETTGGELDATWDVRNLANGDPLDLSWDVRALVTGIVRFQWDVVSQTARGRTLRWDVRNPVLAGVLDLIWSVSELGVGVARPTPEGWTGFIRGVQGHPARGEQGRPSGGASGKISSWR